MVIPMSTLKYIDFCSKIKKLLIYDFYLLVNIGWSLGHCI